MKFQVSALKKGTDVRVWFRVDSSDNWQVTLRQASAGELGLPTMLLAVFTLLVHRYTNIHVKRL